ncbi:MAG: protein translocase subunit SecDF, partial [Clostridiales bacterium]|nr:protein translocase subunit SecDF [Clostridiales bacterium]
MTKRKARIQLILLGVLIVVLGVLSVLKDVPIGKTDYDYNGFVNVIKLGLDLKGGVYAVFSVTDDDPTEAAIDGTVENLRRTLFNKGYTEATVVKQLDR